MNQWIESVVTRNAVGGDTGHWKILFPHLLWNLWKNRNNVIFNSVCWSAKEILERATTIGFMKINTDGSRKMVTGMASAGGLIRDHTGRWLTGFTSKIGKTNNFNAELWGIRDGLCLAIRMGFSSIMLESDSEAAVYVLTKEIDSMSVESTLIADCKLLMRRFQNIRLTHVLREGNQYADFLANLGQTSPWGTSILDSPPEGMITLLERDAMTASFRRLR